MKKIFALILVCALALSFSACKKVEKPETASITVKSENDLAGLAYPTVSNDAESAAPDKPAEHVSEQKTSSEFIDDIHEWDENNVLYNINNTYEITERYYKPFEWYETPSALWHGAGNVSALNEKYDADKAVTFAKAHWNDGADVCAPFISRCLKAGELSIGSDSSTALCFMLLNSRLGFGQFLPMNDDKTISLPEYARRGDVVQLYCSYEGLMIHSMIVTGFDESGRIKVCCHNPENSGQDALRYEKDCNSCLTPLHEVFYFHFYDEGEEPPEQILKNTETLLFENTGYAIPNQHYDRQSAAEYAKNDPIDGIGQFGAEQTTAALAAGGINVGTPIQTATFMQLMKSRHGEMYSVAINPDRTVTLPEFVREGDVCFLYCPDEAMFYSSFIIKGADEHGKMLAYSRDKINNENHAFKVESVCPSSICDANIKEVVIYHFDE